MSVYIVLEDTTNGHIYRGVYSERSQADYFRDCLALNHYDMYSNRYPDPYWIKEEEIEI